MGKPFKVEAETIEGKPLDWTKYAGKPVLVIFWSATNQGSLQELSYALLNYRRYHDKGFEVVGVNVDENKEDVKRMLTVQPLPWETVLVDAAAKNGLVEQCGVASLPFSLLVDASGNVMALHVNAATSLPKVLAKMFPEEPAPGGAPKPTGGAPGAPGGTTAPPPTDGKNSFVEPIEEETHYVAFYAPDLAFQDEEEAVADDDKEAEDDNPYLPPDGLKPAQLVDFLLRMQDKPKSIQKRPGFAEAIVVAADEILKADTKDIHHIIAFESKFDTLHKKASFEDEQADAQLLEFVTRMKDDERPRIAKRVRFYLLERRVMDVDKLPIEKVPGLLDELKEFFGKEKLDATHLRMASLTVHAINRLDVEKREPYFQEFGKLFGASKDREMARYGKKIAKSPSSSSSGDLVGQQIELAGVTTLGVELDWGELSRQGCAG